MKKLINKIKSFFVKGKTISIEIPNKFEYKHEYEHFIKQTTTLIENLVKYDR